MRLAAAATMTLALAGALLISGSRLSSPPHAHQGPPPTPPLSDAITTDLTDYRWPTDAGTIVTSTFAEYRALHFHGGVDVSTGDFTGYHVFAMREGYVSRIRISANGYGKMLFVRHPDGYYSTYAHLSKFSPEIELLARKEQLRTQSYCIDLELQPSDIPVKKGEVIAFTGDTGIGTPHLHFEIRDTNLEPINPQLCPGLLARDGIPPVISKIAITPVGENSRVQGKWESQVFTAHRVRDNHYRINGTILIDGSAGFLISARDRTEGSRFQRGVYKYTLLVDGESIATMTLNRAPIHESQLVGLHFDWSLQDRGLGRFEKLFAETPRILPFLSPILPNAGVVGSATGIDGEHAFTIIASDIAGNQADVSGTFIVSRAPEFTIVRDSAALHLQFQDTRTLDRVIVSARQPDGSWSDKFIYSHQPSDVSPIAIPLPTGSWNALRLVAEDTWHTASHPVFVFQKKPSGHASLAVSHTIEDSYIRVLLRTTGTFTATPTVIVFEGDLRRQISLEAMSENLAVGSFRPTDGIGGIRRIAGAAEVNGEPLNTFEEFELYPIMPGSKGSYTIDGGKLRITYDSLSVYTPLLVQVEKSIDDGKPYYSLTPSHGVLRDGLHVALTGYGVEPHEGLYFHGRASRELIDNHPVGSMYSGVITRTLGDLTLQVDDQPPAIRNLEVRTERSGRVGISFRIRDNLSGVEYDSLKLYIDDTVVIPEIDGEHHKVSYHSDNLLQHGSHQLLIKVNDMAGNPGTVERRFTIR